MNRAATIEQLRRERPRSRFLRGSGIVLCVGVVASWSAGDLAVGEMFSERRLANLERFLTRDALPAPLRDGEGLAGLGAWLLEGLTGRGLSAMFATLGLALLGLLTYLPPMPRKTS